MPATFSAALDSWRQALGTAAVEVEQSRVRNFGRTTAANSPLPLAIIQAASSAQVVAAVKIAHQYQIPIYPISCGKNWGHGDACPVREGQVVLDLSPMNRIVEINSGLAYAVVEPGVTQGQLAKRLDTESGLMLDVTASTPDSSLLGNYVERGDGFSPYGDRFAHCCGMEIVLADGTLMETGYGRFPTSDNGCKYLSKWGVGPSLDGLFSQSNLGIVTRLGIWLIRKPEQVLGLFASVSDAKFPVMIEHLRELHLGGVLQNPIHFYNATRVFASQGRGLETSEKPQRCDRFASLGDWTMWGGFFGDRSLCKARLQTARRHLRGVCHVYAVTENRLRWLDRASRLLWLTGLEDWSMRCQALATTGLDGMRKLSGHPSDNTVRSVCARVSGDQAWDTSRSADLRDHNIGIYWVTHLCPLTSTSITACLEIVNRELGEFNLEPHVTVTVISSRTALCNVTLYFDRTQQSAGNRADECRAQLTAELIGAGFPPYRVGIHGMEMVNSVGTTHADVLKKIKSTLDPHNILASGRYIS